MKSEVVKAHTHSGIAETRPGERDFELSTSGDRTEEVVSALVADTGSSRAGNSCRDTLPLRLAFSVKEAAAILGISEKTVRRLVSRGLLRASRALRHLLIPRKEIERFLEETMQK